MLVGMPADSTSMPLRQTIDREDLASRLLDASAVLVSRNRAVSVNRGRRGKVNGRHCWTLVDLALDKRQLSRYIFIVIRRFRHRGFKRLYEDDDRREVNPQHADKIARMLARLDVATRPEQLDLPGFRLHPLKGELAGYWSITVRANWCIIFRFEDGDAAAVDLVDYH